MKTSTEKRKPGKRKKDNPEQSQRFVETARELGSDESGESFKSTLKKISEAKQKE